MPREFDPLRRFEELWTAARAAEAGDANVAALATADASGRPSVRMILLKGIDPRGFVFYTNFGSRKARDLEANPNAALCVFWEKLYQQVRADGAVERVSDAESDAYFASRPRASQLAAWASRQSETLGSRDELLARYRALEARYQAVEVPRPPFWGGYRLMPDSVEFWQGQEHRLHDRTLYTRDGRGWSVRRLQP